MFTPIFSPIPPSLRVDPHGFRIEGVRDPVDIGFDQIERIEAYKRDEITTDLICFDIWLSPRDASDPYFIHEDVAGFDDLARRLGELPGFDPDWWEKVSRPAFAENRTVVYEKPKGR